MSEIVTVGRRLIPLDHIALVEPFDPSQSRIQTSKEFKARVVMIARESILAEDAPATFAEAHGLRMLPDEGIAVSRRVHFGVEHFEPAEGFSPPKASQVRALASPNRL